MKKYRLYQVDAFTTELFSGNPAGVVPNADGLTEEMMQKIARELNNSETAFIFNPTDDSHDVWVRFFTPTKEVPLCGHATIASHYVRAIENNLDTCTVVQKTGTGNLPVDIIKDGNGYKIIMTQGKPEIAEPYPAELIDRITSALSIPKGQRVETCPVQFVSTGHGKVMVYIKQQSVLDSLTPDSSALINISREINCTGYFVFTLDSNEPGVLTKGRMFAPAIGINEDPVTGNANGPLGVYLVHHELVDHDGRKFSFKGMQGEATGRPGTVDVDVTIENNEAVKVQIGGRARTVFKTEIEI